MRPIAVTEAELAFPADVRKLMPDYKDIPMGFKMEGNEDNKWKKFQSDWMFNGIENLSFSLKEGIDGKMAWRHLKAIQGSFEPKHEHKVAAVAYLASIWFNDVSYTICKRTP